jgi:hypothetical protein
MIGHFVPGLKRPANECREAARFVLKIAQPLQVFDPFFDGFDVPEHHRACRPAAEPMPFAVDFEPGFGQHFVDRQRMADPIHEDFGAAPR